LKARAWPAAAIRHFSSLTAAVCWLLRSTELLLFLKGLLRIV